MGIRLDWEIEAEQSHQRRAGEDPATARQRRLVRLRFLLFLLVILAIFGGVAALVLWRLRAVDAQIEQALRNTVDAEVAALRIGDYTAFSEVQRSASDEWGQIQQLLFNDYQTLKTQQDVQLTGQVLSTVVDRTRARVEVGEILNGVPYTRVWFYWRYDDGWRHVPPDYTFWGDVSTTQTGTVSVRYQAVDALFAQEVGTALNTWAETACATLGCTAPQISVEIIPDETLTAAWSTTDPWLLQIPSPYVKRARTDLPFDLSQQFNIAGLVADRFVTNATNNLQMTYPADAYYLRASVIAWLVGRFAQVDTQAFTIQSLATNYGEGSVGRLLAALQPDTSIAVLASITGGTSLEQANLDWRDFLSWRLMTEDDLIRRGDETNFTLLYDTRDEAVRNLAYQRFREAAPQVNKIVTAVTAETGADGAPVLRATVQSGEGASATQQEVLFKLADGVWKRLN